MKKSDLSVIEYQLGRKLRYPVKEISCKCRFQNPVVILLDTVGGEQITPNLYYLTCPLLIKAVARLEKVGFSKEIMKSLKQEAQEERLEKAHLQYADIRWEKCASDLQRELSEDERRVIEKTGIGGNTNFMHIKCLHSHLASFMSGIDDPIGEKVYGLVKEEYYD